MGKLKRPMYSPSHPNGPTVGNDILVLKNGLWRMPDEIVVFEQPAAGFDKRMNAKTSAAVKKVQRANRITVTGNVGQPTWDEIWPYVDKSRKIAYSRFVVPVEDKDPALVEPRQGWGSLVEGLWLAYAIGREKYGLLDGGPGGWSSGTFNPGSTLPSGAPSSHAKGPPARAFDLDIGPDAADDTGWNNLKARGYFLELVERADELNIGYVILGDKIWSRRRSSEGIRRYTGGGHLNHIHVNFEID